MNQPHHIRTRSFSRSRAEKAGFPDSERTTRSHAGEGLRDGRNVPGIILCALAAVALALALTAAGYGFMGWTVIGAIAGVVLGGLGIAWLLIEHRRVKAQEGLRLRDQRGH